MSDAGDSDSAENQQQQQQHLLNLLGGMPPPPVAGEVDISSNLASGHDSPDAPGPDQPASHHFLNAAANLSGYPGHYLYPGSSTTAATTGTGGAPPPQPPTATKPKPRNLRNTAAVEVETVEQGGGGGGGGGDDEEEGDDGGDEGNSVDEYVPGDEERRADEPDPDEPAPLERRSSKRNNTTNGNGATAATAATTAGSRKTRSRKTGANHHGVNNNQSTDSTASSIPYQVDLSQQQPHDPQQHPFPPPNQLPYPHYPHHPQYPGFVPAGDPYAGLAAQSTLATLQSQTQSQSQSMSQQTVQDDGSYGHLGNGGGGGGGSVNGDDGVDGSGSGGGPGGSGGKRRQRKHQNDEEWNRQRKDNHKEVERRRRGNINQGINELAAIVPNSSGSEKAKGAILTRAVQYIHSLKDNEARNIEKWTLEKLLMDQAMGDLQHQLEEAKRRWEMEFEARMNYEREVEVLKARLAVVTSSSSAQEGSEGGAGQKRQRVE
ncbi:basic helix-loop-helix protein [Tulasnella sp. 331]|nr:basic helix-loop-helix protein [Tulasnella sp. 331]